MWNVELLRGLFLSCYFLIYYTFLHNRLLLLLLKTAILSHDLTGPVDKVTSTTGCLQIIYFSVGLPSITKVNLNSVIFVCEYLLCRFATCYKLIEAMKANILKTPRHKTKVLLTIYNPADRFLLHIEAVSDWRTNKLVWFLSPFYITFM